MSTSRQERAALADLLADVGSEHPTLCGDWTTHDLAAHLVVREGRPDAAIGMVVPPLAGYTQRLWAKATRRPYDELVEEFRDGPPLWSPFRIPAIDRAGNSAEYFVHHEDVRRAAEGWQPREPDAERYRTLLANLRRMGRLSFRKANVTVRLDPQTGSPFTVRTATDRPVVTIVGSPDELTMFAFGRDEQARVELVGESEAVEALRSADRSA